jgi:hypothetical protein
MLASDQLHQLGRTQLENNGAEVGIREASRGHASTYFFGVCLSGMRLATLVQRDGDGPKRIGCMFNYSVGEVGEERGRVIDFPRLAQGRVKLICQSLPALTYLPRYIDQ